jgi:hypothetical protein
VKPWIGVVVLVVVAAVVLKSVDLSEREVCMISNEDEDEDEDEGSNSIAAVVGDQVFAVSVEISRSRSIG